MKKWMVIMLLVALLLFGSVIGFNFYKFAQMGKAMASKPAPVFPVTTLEIKGTDWAPTIEAIGFIEPNQGVEISTQIAGTVDKISFESGTKAKKGTLLLSLNTDVERANLKSSQGKLPAAKANYERMRSLYGKGGVSKGDLDNSQAEYLSLQGQIDSLQATIERMEIRAPFSGQVGLRNVFLGQYLKAGDSIVRLEDTSVMKIRFTIPQTDLAKIKVGQPLNILVDAYPKQPFKGTIAAIEPVVKQLSGVIEVQAAIPNTEGLLRSGMYAKVQVQLPVMKEQIVIPQTAVNFTLYGQTVYVIEDGKDAKDQPAKIAKQVVVNVGERVEDSAHILSGLKPGDIIVTSGQIRLSNGSQVKAVSDNTLAKPAVVPAL